jgi:hypothetical protein
VDWGLPRNGWPQQAPKALFSATCRAGPPCVRVKFLCERKSLVAKRPTEALLAANKEHPQINPSIFNIILGVSLPQLPRGDNIQHLALAGVRSQHTTHHNPQTVVSFGRESRCLRVALSAGFNDGSMHNRPYSETVHGYRARWQTSSTAI